MRLAWCQLNIYRFAIWRCAFCAEYFRPAICAQWRFWFCADYFRPAICARRRLGVAPFAYLQQSNQSPRRGLPCNKLGYSHAPVSQEPFEEAMPFARGQNEPFLYHARIDPVNQICKSKPVLRKCYINLAVLARYSAPKNIF
jgi:hypothetical protein